MRALLSISLLVVVFLLPGCASKKATNVPQPGGSSASAGAFTETAYGQPGVESGRAGAEGVVAKVNSAGRFVVLTFPPGQVPPADQVLSLYRVGTRVGEVKVTGPQVDEHVVADLVSGDAQPGDSVRNR